MKIENNKVVSLTYELEADGKVVDRVTKDKPLEYIQGMHMLIAKFEEAVASLEEGSTFDFTLSPADGYGDYDPKMKFDVPRTAFTINGEIREDLMQPGRTLPMINSSGHVVNAVVCEVKEDGVTLDFNHPMAGKALHFKGEILSVRDATGKELAEGLHGEFLPPEEGCRCGHHHDGDGAHHCCHGEGHHDHNGDHECCHGEGHHDHNGDHECCHGEGHHHDGDGEHHCCHGHGHHDHDDDHECCRR